MAKIQRKKKKKVLMSDEGMAHIKATFNNTIITLTDTNGNVISWASSGALGFKGSRKSTPFAAGQASEKAALEAIELGLKKVKVEVKGQVQEENLLLGLWGLQGLKFFQLKM